MLNVYTRSWIDENENEIVISLRKKRNIPFEAKKMDKENIILLRGLYSSGEKENFGEKMRQWIYLITI